LDDAGHDRDAVLRTAERHASGHGVGGGVHDRRDAAARRASLPRRHAESVSREADPDQAAALLHRRAGAPGARATPAGHGRALSSRSTAPGGPRRRRAKTQVSRASTIDRQLRTRASMLVNCSMNVASPRFLAKFITRMRYEN